MAKLKTDDMPADITAPAADIPKAPDTPPAQDPESVPETPAPKSSSKPKSAPAPSAEEPSPEVQHLLRLHPQYETLYIDRHGGIYAPGTPKCVRGEAPLYRNSFYKPDKQ